MAQPSTLMPAFCGHIGKVAVAIVVIEDRLAIASDQQVDDSRHCRSRRPPRPPRTYPDSSPDLSVTSVKWPLPSLR